MSKTSQELSSVLILLNICPASKKTSSDISSWKVVSSLRMVSAALMLKNLKQSKQAPSLMLSIFCLLYIDDRKSIEITSLLYSFGQMYTHPHGFGRSKMGETASTWISREECNFLANVNYKLVNEINESETEKHFYKTKLAHEARGHHDQLQEAFHIMNQKNAAIIDLEEEVDRCKKDLRAAADDYITLKRNAESEKEYLQAELANTKAACEEKINKIQEETQRRYELKLKKRVQEVQNECSDRIKMYTGQITLLTENSRTLSHQLAMLQEDYRQMLLKNDTIIQESIHRQLRKRDFQAQNNYLHDLAQYETIKKERNQLKQTIEECSSRIAFLSADNKRLVAQLEVESQKMKDLAEAFQQQKQEERLELNERYKESCEADTNTDKQFVPIALPVDMNLMSEVVSLKEFLVEKIVFRFMDFFEKSAGGDGKKTSKSLLMFSNCLEEMKQRNPELNNLFFMHTTLQKIIKVYCPALTTYSREFLTIKDAFIKKTLMECETITSQPQRLFRILDLFFRIKNPLNHLHPEVTAGELKLVQLKLMGCLKKIFL